jgi:murein DD-endopeptidase MepM/ murein hydrolase activator NlpD
MTVVLQFDRKTSPGEWIYAYFSPRPELPPGKELNLDTPQGRWYICNGFLNETQSFDTRSLLRKVKGIMTSDELKKHLRRKLTVMLIPHSNMRPIRLNLSIALLTTLATAWTGLTLWSGFIASRHVDYWRTKADEQVMRAKVWYYSQQIRKSREYLDRVRETELSLEKLLDMKTRKAIVTSDHAMGGAGLADQKQLASLLNRSTQELSVDDIKDQFDDMQRAGHDVLDNYQQISSYIKDQRELYRATPIDWPTKGRLTSYFGRRRFPIESVEGVEREEFHRGIDIANHEGTPVLATADGIVRIASWQGGYGRLIVLDHGRGFRTYYGHNSSLLVKPGDLIKRGQEIAKMGTSGMSTGYHCHYEVWHNGQVLNPLKFVKADDIQQ